MIKPKLRLLNNKFTEHSLVYIFLSAFIFYLICSVIFLGPNSINDLSHYVFSNGGDPQQFIWYYNWWPYAISHHLNPFISKYVWYPNGYNVSWATSIPSLSLIMVPVTFLGGALLSYNIVALLSPVLAAFSCFVLVYYLTKKYLASLLSGYLFGFSSFELGQLLGHPQVYVIFLLPVLILLFVSAYRQRLRPLYYILLTAVILALQIGISLEITATLITFSALTWLIFYWLKAADRKRLLATAKYTLYALFVCLVIASIFIYYLISGFHNVPRTIHPLIPFSTNAANLFVPTPITLIGGGDLSFLSKHFTANISENGAYLGLPLLAALLFVTIRYWHNKIIRALSISLIVIGLASLGPRLHIIGQVGTKIWMPWALFSKVPIIDSAQPDRFSVYFFLLAAVILALWLSQKHKNSRSLYTKYLLVLVGVVAIIPNTTSYIWSKPEVPKVFQKQYIKEYLPNKPNVLILPFNGSGIYYQYVSDMAFTQTGGYVGFIPTDYASNPIIDALKTGVVPSDFNKLFASFCKSNDITKIVYIKNLTQSSLIKAINSLNWPEKKVGGSVIVSNVYPYSKLDTSKLQ